MSFFSKMAIALKVAGALRVTVDYQQRKVLRVKRQIPHQTYNVLLLGETHGEASADTVRNFAQILHGNGDIVLFEEDDPAAHLQYPKKDLSNILGGGDSLGKSHRLESMQLRLLSDIRIFLAGTTQHKNEYAKVQEIDPEEACGNFLFKAMFYKRSPDILADFAAKNHQYEDDVTKLRRTFDEYVHAVNRGVMYENDNPEDSDFDPPLQHWEEEAGQICFDVIKNYGYKKFSLEFLRLLAERFRDFIISKQLEKFPSTSPAVAELSSTDVSANWLFVGRTRTIDWMKEIRAVMKKRDVAIATDTVGLPVPKLVVVIVGESHREDLTKLFGSEKQRWRLEEKNRWKDIDSGYLGEQSVFLGEQSVLDGVMKVLNGEASETRDDATKKTIAGLSAAFQRSHNLEHWSKQLEQEAEAEQLEQVAEANKRQKTEA